MVGTVATRLVAYAPKVAWCSALPTKAGLCTMLKPVALKVLNVVGSVGAEKTWKCPALCQAPYVLGNEKLLLPAWKYVYACAVLVNKNNETTNTSARIIAFILYYLIVLI